MISKSEVIGILKYTLAILGWIVFMVYISGCSTGNTLKDIRDSNLTQGCVTVELLLNFDSYFNTTKGSGEVCKLKCSNDLPENFYYRYDNSRTGCHQQVGIPNAD